MFNENGFFGDSSPVFFKRILAHTVGVKDGTLTLRVVALVHPKIFFEKKL